MSNIRNFPSENERLWHRMYKCTACGYGSDNYTNDICGACGVQGAAFNPNMKRTVGRWVKIPHKLTFWEQFSGHMNEYEIEWR